MRPGIPEFMKAEVVPRADIVTPNHFELDYLAGTEVRTLPEMKAAITAIQALGPRVVVVTSAHTADTPVDAIDLIAGDGGRFWRVRTPKLGVSVNGAGDCIAALFFVHYLRSRAAREALGRAAASTYGLVKRTAEANSREILLVEAQEEFVKPTTTFAVEAV